MIDVVVGLGSNVGSREAFLRAAVQSIGALDRTRVVATSRVFTTPPLGPPQPEFLNMAARIETEITGEPLIDRLLEIEAALGRERREKWGPRTIDLDVLWWSAPPIATSRLTVPHPHLGERPFALAPLLDVAPELGGALGAALARAGGAPERARPFQRVPPVAINTGEPGRVSREARADDSADALAALITALAPAAGEPPARVAALRADSALAFTNEALAGASTGQALVSVVISALGPAEVIGRALVSARPSPAIPPRAEALALGPRSARATVPI